MEVSEGSSKESGGTGDVLVESSTDKLELCGSSEESEWSDVS